MMADIESYIAVPAPEQRSREHSLLRLCLGLLGRATPYRAGLLGSHGLQGRKRSYIEGTAPDLACPHSGCTVCHSALRSQTSPSNYRNASSYGSHGYTLSSLIASRSYQAKLYSPIISLLVLCSCPSHQHSISSVPNISHLSKIYTPLLISNSILTFIIDHILISIYTYTFIFCI